MAIVNLRVENNFVIIEFDQPDSKVNVLSAASLGEFEKIITQLSQRKDLSGACIASAKPDIFIAGADIKEIENITIAAEAEAKAKAGQKILNALEKLPFPTVALINGACAGGGLELALVCDWRLASFGEKVKLGLPEVKLGIIPGFGGTKRLPRLVGLRKGLELILSGELVGGNEALKIGLVDGLCSQSRLLEEGINLLKQKKSKRKVFKPKIKGLMNLFLETTYSGKFLLARQTKKFILQNTRGHYPAPLAGLRAVVKNYTSSLDAALKREARAFAKLAITPVSKNLISVFYLIEKYKKLKWTEAKPLTIRKCACLGAGVMGGGIAQLFSAFGLPVRMKDLNFGALGRGLKQAREVYDYAVKKRKLKPHQAAFGMGLISTTTDYSGFASADLIVEAVVEDPQVKKNVFGELDLVAKDAAILASNTSCLSVAQMSEKVINKQRVAGMHFFNPVHRMPLIEIIRSKYTSDETVATLVEFSRKLGKIPLVVRDECGFLVNRILIPYLDEAGFILEEGVAFERIDRLMLEFGMPMGPFTLIDEIGIDVGSKVAYLLEAHFGERMKVPQILKTLYEKKWFGKKSGKGFYIHKGKKKIPNHEIYNFLPKSVLETPGDKDIVKRMVYKMINEAARCLEEKVCKEPSDVDLGMIMGTGFPPFKAGLLRYADSVGVTKIAADLERLKIAPCAYLAALAKENGKFYRQTVSS